jgi:hypothetical protein
MATTLCHCDWVSAERGRPSRGGLAPGARVEVVAAIHRRLLGPANKSTRNLADNKRGFRINK